MGHIILPIQVIYIFANHLQARILYNKWFLLQLSIQPLATSAIRIKEDKQRLFRLDFPQTHLLPISSPYRDINRTVPYPILRQLFQQPNTLRRLWQCTQ